MQLIKSRFLAASLALLLLVSVSPFQTAFADEGMFMLDKVSTLPLRQKGLKISPTDIYNPAGGGLSEAAVRLSIGCTGEFVSPDGLILTNHHCGYDALVAASTTQANYGEVGYKADSRQNELPAKNYSISITLKSEDVTAQVLNGIAATGEAREAMIAKRLEDLQTEERGRLGRDQTVQVQALNNGLFYYKFVYQTVRDIRIVYAPPKSIGFYGGDPDNFEWTRHTGDFTFMRAYVAPDGRAAEYSTANVPFKPRKFLTINAEGVKDNDLTMVIGYPGGTTRYRESYSVAFNQDVRLPFLVDYFNAQIAAYEEAGRGNEEKRVKYQGEIFNLANSRKAFEGGVVAMRRAGLVGQKQADEARFEQWLNADAARKAKYGEALPALRTAYVDYLKTAQRDLILQFMLNVAPIQFVAGALSGQASKDDLKKAVAEVAAGEPVVNRELLRFFLRRAAELPAGQRIAAIEKRFGGLQGEARRRAEDSFARNALEGQGLTTEAGLNSILAMPAEQLRGSNDQFLQMIAEIVPELPAAFAGQQKLNAAVNRYRLPFTQGMIEMRGTTAYPDANSTQRFSYGNVSGYSPREAVSYSPFTTLNGVFEKDTGREPFDAPAKLRRLWQQKDFGVWNVGGTVPVNFLTTNDIIGGNSGSPVLNANGEQVGIVFDGNYEGLGNDFFFNPALGRTIAVDIRYVLFLTEKFGDAGWILKEMNIKGAAGAKAATAKN